MAAAPVVLLLRFSFINPYYTGQKMLGSITFSIIFSDMLNLTVYFNTSAYVVAIVWRPFVKNLTVLSISETELRSVKYGNPTKWSVQKYGRWPPLKFGSFFQWLLFFYVYILGKMLYFSIIMTTAGIKWCNDGIPEIFEFCLKNMFLTKISKFWFLSEIVVHMNANSKPKTPSKSEHSNVRYDLLKLSVTNSCIFQCKLH